MLSGIDDLRCLQPASRFTRALIISPTRTLIKPSLIAPHHRDTDLAILANSVNLAKLKNALEDLQATVIAVPPFEAKYLRKGHAVHFRCHHPEALGMRIDVMTKMRGVDSFLKLWARRTTLAVADDKVELMSLPDLVQAKKTQSDKDWPMLRRLIEVNYFATVKIQVTSKSVSGFSNCGRPIC